MYNIFLSIAFSVLVGVLIKLLRNSKPQMTQVVMWNYVCAGLLCVLLFKPDLSAVTTNAPWGVFIALGVLLPSIFLFLAASIRHMGIVKTDAAQRMSLCIPLLAAWLLFREDFSQIKIVALAIGIPAILMILYKKSDNSESKWIYPTAVLLGFGTIDILFKKVAIFKEIPYTTSLFVIFILALMFSIAMIGYEMFVKKIAVKLKNVRFGLILGALNFGNIYFYLRAHQAFAENPSTVFATMNIGVIVAGSLIGVLAFREKLSWLNYIGLIFAVVAILMIAFFSF